MRTIFTLLFSLLLSITFSHAQNGFWRQANEALINTSPEDRSIIPDAYTTYYLEINDLRNYLRDAPMEFSQEARQSPLLLDMPMPSGEIATFAISESPLMEAGLAEKYPDIKTYAGYSTSERGIKLRFTLSTLGFSAAMTHLVSREVYYIDAYANGITDYYICYNVKDHQSNIPPENLRCSVDDYTPTNDTPATSQNNTFASTRGAGEIVNLRVYRVAITTTGEWGNNFGSLEEVLAKITEGVSRLNQIFEVDLALRIILVEDNDQLIFMDPATDPYPNANASGELIGLNTGVINQIIGFDAYEFGHLFNSSCDTGGLASLGAVCGGNKASAITCHYTSNFEYAMVRITAHEMGHSFDAPHTWNLCQIGSTDNMNSGTAYEPGSGNTIMSYHGVCNPTQDVPEGPHDYYHANSLERIYNFTDGFGGNCPETTETDNHFPEITLPYTNGFYIPISTPFELYAEATDEDGDQLTYCWEQYDLSPLNTPLGSPQGNEPSFRSFPPTPDPMRVFPRMSNVLSNTSTNYEVLPTYSRTLTFRCSVRDNNPTIGAAVWDEVGFFATQEAGPFLVMVPNGPELWTVGDYTEVTWDVANTDGDLVNCQHVNILLSVDGGQTFPYTLAENTPNDGSRFVVVPQAVTNLARVRIEAADNIFFDLSNGNFSIQEASAPGFNFDAFPHMQQVCIPESATIELPMISILGFEDPVTFSVEGLPNGAVANFTNNPANPADGTELTIDMSNAEQVSAQYEVLITAMVEGVDTILRTVYLNTVSNDFSTLALAAPSYGEVNVIETPTFDWATTNNAFAYEFQLATSPSFSPESIVEEQTLTAPPFISDILLEKSTAYFWRIRPVNDCGPGPYTSTFAFHTEVFACANYASVNVPVNISAQGTPTVESVIEVTESGSISDINVIKIKGQHDLVKHIAVSLVSPEGTEVEMFSGVCPGSNTALFNMGIDDESPLSISCPPNAGISYQPQTPGIMATFNGEDSQGLWTLKVKVINTDGNGGSLQEWALQICSNATVAAPFLVNNELLLVPPGAFNYILQDELFTDDEDNAPNELEYTIVEAPTQGNLIYQGEVLEVGEVFRQSTINAGNLTYAHTPGAEMTDQFVFTVSDGNGGWVPPTVFQIQMDPNATVSTTNLFKENRLLVFPNPTNSFLNVKLATPINAPIEARLYNVQGQLVASQLTKTGMDLIQFDAKRLSAGLYFVELSLKGERIVEKVAVFK